MMKRICGAGAFIMGIAVLSAFMPAQCSAGTAGAAPGEKGRCIVWVAGIDGKTYEYAEFAIPLNNGFGEPALLEREESKDDLKMIKLIDRRREKNNEAREAARLDALAKALTATNAADLQKVVSGVDKYSDEYDVPDDRYDVNSADGRSVLTFVAPVSLRANRALTFAATQVDRKPYLIDLKTLEVQELPATLPEGSKHVNFRFRWSPDGKLLAYKTARDTIGIFDLHAKAMRAAVRCDGQVDDMVWNSAGNAVAAAVLTSAPSFRKVTDIIASAKRRESESRHVMLCVIDAASGKRQERQIAKYVRRAHTCVEWTE